MILISINAGINGLIEFKENDRSIVELDQNESKKIVFYRDDCPDCQKIFRQLYFHNTVHNDTIFVNLNREENRKYIDNYQIESVPTILNQGSRYEGTNKQKIRKILNDSR